MKASLAKGLPHGYEVGYKYFTINGRMLGHGEPVRVKRGERILFHVLNGSATEIRSLALPGHSFKVIALDGNSITTPTEVPVLWLGTAERVSATVEMNHPGVWVLGDLPTMTALMEWGLWWNTRNRRASHSGRRRSRFIGTMSGLQKAAQRLRPPTICSR